MIKNFSIIIPVYNESKNILNLLQEIISIKKIENYYEIIIVDDCSADDTVKILENNSKKFKFTLIKQNKNCGQSLAIQTGVLKSQFNTIVTIDGDGQNDPKDMPKLLTKYFASKDYYLVAGIRLNRKDSLIKIISSRIANKIRGFILKDNCPDTGCTLKVFDKKIFLDIPFFNGIHRFIPALFQGYGVKTFFIEVAHRPRIFGKSKYGTIDRLFRGIIDIIKVLNIIKKMN